jgi:sulfur-oxidizing protein SoxY
MPLSRRTFVRASLIGSAFTAVVSSRTNAGLPPAVLSATSPADAIRAALGSDKTVPDERIRVIVPDRAENGDVVPVSVDADLPNVQRITLVADKNPSPVIATFALAPEVEGFVATRIKLAETCNVTAIVESAGKLHSGSKPVQVLIGGCGGE